MPLSLPQSFGEACSDTQSNLYSKYLWKFMIYVPLARGNSNQSCMSFLKFCDQARQIIHQQNLPKKSVGKEKDVNKHVRNTYWLV